MAAHQTSVTEAISLDYLDDYLMSDSSPAESMLLSDLDGFLTGISVGPEAIPPDEWLPAIWARLRLSLTMRARPKLSLGHYGPVRGDRPQIDNEIVEPIFWQSGDTVIAWDWADGFVESFALRQRRWTKMVKSEAGILLVPIMTLCDPENLLDELEIEEKERAVDNAIEALPDTVLAIAAYWRMSEQLKKSVSADLRSVARTGRNDPCPCGSVKKFKKCCGIGP
ncbi:YecA family protein [Rhizobium grahamii]|uniref:YecA family protein n=1 Tax=Rhizobium grahamii TaxID=1120045 RepID=A0A370KHD4_9HYPH|nr:YecA family protein [Rhizobium grahamii]RDJ04527.1 hypothetical protein B5K06_26985 [Rhizobium grahamii]